MQSLGIDIKSQIIDYADRVLSGELVASRWVRLACERFKRDLAASESEDYPYRFNWQEAEDACIIFPAIFRHYKGEWAGDPIELTDFQTFVTGNIMGWQHKETGLRRFRRAFVSVARKNGKTTWAAGLAILLAFFDAEAGAEVYIGATKLDQAKILFADAEAMIRKSTTLDRYASRFVSSIRFKENDSLIKPLGSDKPYDGLNPHGVFLDELHAFTERHRKFYDTMKTGGGARRQPMLCTITTAGDDKSELWKEEVDYCRKVLDGVLEDVHLFAYIAEIDEEDDPFDESVWIKANPGLGASIKIDYLREQAAQAQANHAAKNRFLRYHMNTMTSSTEQAIDLVLWEDAGTGLSDWSEADAIAAGFDLGGRDDLASYAMAARFQIGEEDDKPVYRYEVRQRSFMSSDTKRDLREQPWGTWIDSGLLTVGRYVVDDLADALIKDCESLGVEDIAYDPYQANQLAGQLEQQGLKPIKMAQNYFHFNEPIRLFLSCLSEGRITHGGDDPLLRYCCSNAVIVRDRSDKWMFDKSSTKDKIDPVVAMVMAIRACGIAKPRSTGSMFMV